MLAAETSVVLTDHAEYRAARRNSPPAALEYVLTYGRRIQRYPRDLLFLGTARGACPQPIAKSVGSLNSRAPWSS